MGKPTTDERDTIRAFLKFCLRTGFYEFEVNGKVYSLDTESDLESILEAICTLDPPLFNWRLKEAEQVLKEILVA